MTRWLFLFIGLSVVSVSAGQDLRVLAEGETPNDRRLDELKTLNGHFPFKVPDNAGAWHERADALRRRVLVATGLWPMPEKTPLNAKIYGKTERDGFTVEKVHFESLPGHFVTGLLFRPDPPEGQSESRATKVPGVLSPHGHGGRMQTHSDQEIARQIASGAEHFQQSGKTPKIARCAQLARMGCVCFIFDMLGYEDSVQISYEVAHRHADQRAAEESSTPEQWVFFSDQAELRCQSIMGLQTWNAIRALDFLASLPDVDADRLAVTGGSGGGTQSILLGAIDPRIKVSFPNGMVSTAMQGGCYCENCNLLRIDTGNVELAALFAPRPQAMTAADDWTVDMMHDGYPELKWLYAMIGDESDVYCRPMLQYKHNYNYIARATMYQWMNRHLELGLDDPVIEQDFRPLTAEEAAIWNDEHPAPTERGVPHERNVCRWLDQQAQAKLAEVMPTDEASLQAFRNIVGGAWRVLFDQGLPAKVSYQQVDEVSVDDITVAKGLLHDPARGAQLPLLIATNQQSDPGKIVIWSSDRGKAAAFDEAGQATETLSRILSEGATVLLPDLLSQGEFVLDGSNVDRQRTVDDSRHYAAFTFGYNRTLTAHRCADLLSVIAYARESNQPIEQATSITLLGTSGTAGWVAPAAAIAGSVLQEVIVQPSGFRYAQIEGYQDPGFVPGAVKYGDLPALLALRSPHRLSLVGLEEIPSIVSDAYRAAGAEDQLNTIEIPNRQE